MKGLYSILGRYFEIYRLILHENPTLCPIDDIKCE